MTMAPMRITYTRSCNPVLQLIRNENSESTGEKKPKVDF